MFTLAHIHTLQCSNRTVPADTISNDGEDDDTVLWDRDRKLELFVCTVCDTV